MTSTDTILVILGAMLTLNVILTLAGIRIMQKVSEDAQAIAAMSKTTLDAIARLLVAQKTSI